MPVTPASAAPPYPPLRHVFPLARLGQQLAMVFLILVALTGFAGMTLLCAFQILLAQHDPGLFNERLPQWQRLSTILDIPVFALCLYQIGYRGRSWIIPAITLTLILGSLASNIMDFARSDYGRDRIAYIQIIAIHSGIQILTAGALVALRRIHWIDWLPQKEAGP